MLRGTYGEFLDKQNITRHFKNRENKYESRRLQHVNIKCRFIWCHLVLNHNINFTEDKTTIIYNKDYNKYLTTNYIQHQKKKPKFFFSLFIFSFFFDTIETLLKPFISLQLLIIRDVIISTALPWGYMPVHDFPKDGDHGVIIKFINGDHVEVSQEARGHRVPATTWWAHGSHDLDVNQLHGCGFLQVIPVPVIQPLS